MSFIASLCTITLFLKPQQKHEGNPMSYSSSPILLHPYPSCSFKISNPQLPTSHFRSAMPRTPSTSRFKYTSRTIEQGKPQDEHFNMPCRCRGQRYIMRERICSTFRFSYVCNKSIDIDSGKGGGFFFLKSVVLVR